MDLPVNQTTSFPADDLPAQPVPSSSKSKFPVVLFALILLIGAGFGGFLLGKHYFSSKPFTPRVIVKPEVSPFPTSTATVTLSPNLTDEWKTYTKSSKNFGAFSLKYPKDWSVEDRLSIEAQSKDPGNEQTLITFSKTGYIIEINAFLDGWSPSGCNFDDRIKNQPQIFDYDGFIEVNNPAIQLRRALPPVKTENTLAWTICAKEGVNNSYATAFPFSGTVAYLTPQNFEDKMIEEMDQILSTLRFL